jgi:VIT1/CCC1 family predicted Fe2+/Mn2+ transporter
MVLSFTCTISISASGRQEVRELLIAAIGCNFAWGLVDAIMYLMEVVIERSRGILNINSIKKSTNKSDSRQITRDNFPPFISEQLDDDEIDKLNEKIKKLPEITLKKALVIKDFLVSGQIFLLVFISTFPVAVPFLLFNNIEQALRISNAIALLMLFIGGFMLAKYSGLRPFITGLIYASLGILLVAITILLGG